MKYYKWLDKDGRPCHGGNGTYSLPTKNDDGTWTPGEWMADVEGYIIPCKNGYHLCREQDLVHWIAPELYEAEYRGTRIDEGDKIVVRSVRLLRKVEAWNDNAARKFACWCALQVAHLWDMPDIVRKYLETQDEHLRVAARDAAWGDARAAARAASEAAAMTAARDAAWDAAWAAAGVAALSAARAAAGVAARAASEAAAGVAAGVAALSAARDAARAEQTKHLLEVIR